MSVNALYGKCPTCNHVWIVARLPMQLSKAAQLAKRAACPACGEVKAIRVATEEDVRRATGGRR